MTCKQIGKLLDVSYEQSTRVYDIEGLSPTVVTSAGGGHEVKIMDTRQTEKSQIRRLTPMECWRLMGFDDNDFEKAQAVNSDTQLYKQAGNSIVVNVLEAILRNLLRKEWLDSLLTE